MLYAYVILWRYGGSGIWETWILKIKLFVKRFVTQIIEKVQKYKACTKELPS